MSKCIRACAAIGLFFGLVACDMQPQEEFTVVEREAIDFGTVDTGKFR